MKTILIITSCFLSSVVGRFTPGEIEAEVRKYDNIARRVQGIVDPMYIQVREEKERIGAPLQEAIDTLRQEAEEINRRREACYQEIGALRQANDEMLQRLKERRENRLREILDPLRAELAAKRVPIIEQVQKLKTEREDIEREHYRLKGDPLWGRWMDGIESMDTGMRMAFKAEAIKGLFASVDGDLPKQIEAKQQEVEKEYLEKEAV